jgi:cytochrome c oxidase subunit II
MTPKEVRVAPSTGPRSRRRSAGRATTSLVALLTLAACSPRDSMTAPVGPEAADIAWLWWFILILGTIVYVVVMALVAIPLARSWRFRRRGEVVAAPADPEGAGGGTRDAADDPTSDIDPAEGPAAGPGPGGRPHPASADPGGGREAEVSAGGLLGTPPASIEDEPLAQAPDAAALDPDADRQVRSRLIWLGGIIIPVIILAVLLVATSVTGQSVAHVAEDEDLVIDVIGHKFWWEVHYPDHDVVTANEVHVPIDQRVRLNLHTEDVIHSWWIPRVHGKVDMIPGSDNIMTFTVEEPGRYRGQCAEYCGVAHAQMAKFLVAQEPDDFEAWVEGQQQDALEPATEEQQAGQQAYFEYGCADCHGVSGHGAAGGVGPDLTHLASRDSLAAGIVPNDREHLAELIVDPWGVKTGNPMPPTNIPDDDLEVLLDYLEGLE